MADSYLVRAIETVTREPYGVRCRLRAVGCVQLPGMPGYLTSEPYEVQGIEQALPNLPDLDLPDARECELELRVVAVADDTCRITVAPVGGTVLDADGTGPGIVTDPYPAPAQVTVAETDEAIEVRTPRFEVRLGRSPFSVRIDDPDQRSLRMRTAERLRQAAGPPMAPAVVLDEEQVRLHLEMGPDEDILGFGEQFSAVVKNGQQLRLSVADALGTGTGAAYKPVPVWHSTTGYTGLLNTGAVIDADVGHTRPSVLGLSVGGDEADVYLFIGDSPGDRLGSYTRLTGRADPPPLWALGYWMGRCRYHSREQMLGVADDMRRHDVPCDVLHLDPDWLVTDRLNCDFIWNTDRFGDRREFVDALAERGVRLSMWELPYLDPASPRYDEAVAHGYLVRARDGSPAQVAGTPTPDGRHRGLVDFGNDEAVRWWQDLHADFLDDGVAVFKTDFGEGLPIDVALSDGTSAEQAHNLYPLRYNAAVSDGIRRLTGRAPLVWGRSGWAGSHRYPGQWGGDAESSVAGMRATLRGGLSYAMSAPGLWSHDIGGFFGPELTSGLYVRWTQFGALSPMMRAHGLRPREPWAFDEQTLRICRRWIRLRYELLPYLWQTMHESLASGRPVLRPLTMEFPDDPVAVQIDSQYLLGSDLLVVPVFDDGVEPVERRFYVPAGSWRDLESDEVFTGPGFVTRTVPLSAMPVLVREGAVIPRVSVGASDANTDALVGREWTLEIHGGADRDVELLGFDGTPTYAALRGDSVTSTGSQPIAPTARR